MTTPSDPDEIAKQAREHAWNWFALHATQRLQAFNFFVVATAFLIAAYASLLDKAPAAAAVLAMVGAWLAFWFNRLDARNCQLVEAGEDALRVSQARLASLAENSHLMILDAVERPASGASSYRRVINVIQWTIITLFLLAAIYATWFATSDQESRDAGLATATPQRVTAGRGRNAADHGGGVARAEREADLRKWFSSNQQSTVEEIIESERDLVLTADQRYGDYSRHASECALFLSRCIRSVDRDRMMFARFLSLLKKHHMLALLSALRLHKVQTTMNLRQVLEAGAAAAFAIANPEPEHFATTDAQGFIDPSQELTKKRHQWLDKNFPGNSAAIKENKDRINDYFAHANVVLTNQTFEVDEAIKEISTPFFDVEDEFQVKFDLWLTASISIDLMYLLYGVNKGRDVVKFIPNFESDLHQFHQRNSALRREMQSTERYKRAFAMMPNLSE